MIKQVSINVEYCDHCKENEAYKNQFGTIITCECCGKVLCDKCRSYVLGISVCPDCKKEKFKRYYYLVEKMDELLVQYEEVRKDYEEEVNRLVIDEVKRLSNDK
ncbi:MAG: hypothetical protein ABFD07_14095 [Methanobacterium sp.]